MAERYDVIIAGAGPAGGTAAFFLGQAGKRVLVLEKEQLPRYKTCGGGISRRFLENQFPFSFEPILQVDVRRMMYDFRGYSVTVPIQGGVVSMVMRDKLDAFILSHSKAEVRQGCAVRQVIETADRVEVETQSGEVFEADYLIGADGANSRVAHSTGLRQKKRMVAAIEVEAKVPPEVLRRFADRPVFIFGEIRYGYLWIFPKPDHLSVGVAAMRPKRGELQTALKRVMRRYHIPLEGVPFHGHPIPLYTGREPITTRRILLAGDAAGLVDPLSGEGIRFAIKSGSMAAQAIIAGRPEDYSKEVFRQIGINHLLALATAQVFYNLEGLCLLLGAPNPFTTQAIGDLLSDNAGSIEIMLRAIATLPLFVLTEVIAGVAGLLGGPQARRQVRQAVYSVSSDS